MTADDLVNVVEYLTTLKPKSAEKMDHKKRDRHRGPANGNQRAETAGRKAAAASGP